MKKSICIFVIIIASISSIFSYDLLKIGDNVSQYIIDNPIKVKFGQQSISDWPEGNITLLGYGKAGDGKSPIIIFSNDEYLIGVLQGTSSNAYYLFDINGDNILDTKSSTPILPYWPVFLSSKNKTNTNNISPILELTYDSFQSDEGPMKNPKMQQSLKSLFAFKDDVNSENRDLAYLYYFYQANSGLYPEQSLICIELLTNEFEKRFGKIHPVLLLYTAETLINLGDDESAKTIISNLREIDPDFIPAKVYKYQLEKNKKNSKALLKELKENHPKHWIVKTL